MAYIATQISFQQQQQKTKPIQDVKKIDLCMNSWPFMVQKQDF